MNSSSPDFSTIIQQRKILYAPTCLLIESMTRLYSYISTVNPLGPEAAARNLLPMVEEFRCNLSAIRQAYADNRIKFFIGDWREDRRRAASIMSNLLARLAFMGAQAIGGDRDAYREEIHLLGQESEDLMRTLDSQSSCTGTQCNGCRYFKCVKTGVWQNVMARAILGIHEDGTGVDDDTALLLLCYKRMKTLLLLEIANIEKKNTSVGRTGKFDPDKIICLSDEDVKISCPTCMKMTDGVIHTGQAEKNRAAGLVGAARGAQAGVNAGRGSGTRRGTRGTGVGGTTRPIRRPTSRPAFGFPVTAMSGLSR